MHISRCLVKVVTCLLFAINARAFDDVQTLCSDSKIIDQETAEICRTLSSIADRILNNPNKRFLRFGRALSGDIFLRFGRNYPSNSYGFHDKRFLRFGRRDMASFDDFPQAVGDHSIKKRSVAHTDKSDDSKKENKSSKQTSQTYIKSVEDAISSQKSNDNRNIESVNSQNSARIKRLSSGKAPVKKFMRFGRQTGFNSELNADPSSSVDKRFMRFGRTPDVDKRFMRFGRDPSKRFMRFGRDSEKRFMRFGRAPDVDKRFMRFGRSGENTKRFMRFGRTPDKRFMRFGRSV